MAGLVKELLLDYGLNRLSVDMRSDLTIAIQSALSSSVFNTNDAKMLDLYLSGYTAEEIAVIMNMMTAKVNEYLWRIFTAIEEHSGYTDDGFIHKLELTHKYRKSGMRALGVFLEQHSQVYDIHELEVK
jgi:hypothetical protein